MPRILIVDDNEEDRESLSRRLERRGFEVVTAENGKVGVSTAQSEKPDLILMNMNMPELDGWDAARQIKAMEELRAVPIIAVTAQELAGDKERAIAAGCVDFHTKPLDFSTLLSQIEALLQNRQP
jgi:CheY-like chemotaxis protein